MHASMLVCTKKAKQHTMVVIFAELFDSQIDGKLRLYSLQQTHFVILNRNGEDEFVDS